MFKLSPSHQNILLRLTLLLFLLVMTSARSVLAVDPTIDPPPETAEEAETNKLHNTLLREGNYEQLDREMNQIQFEYEQGIRDDISLLHLSYAFYDNDAGLEAKFNDWVTAYPQSYSARVARGIFLRRIARTARGTAYISETQEQQLTTMEIYLERAMDDLQESFSLTKKPLLTHYNILCVARLLGERELGDNTLKVANEIDPKNFIARYKYMGMLQTRWGGSLQEMQEFRQEVEKVGFSSDLVQLFDDLISDEIVWLANLEQGNR